MSRHKLRDCTEAVCIEPGSVRTIEDCTAGLKAAEATAHSFEGCSSAVGTAAGSYILLQMKYSSMTGRCPIGIHLVVAALPRLDIGRTLDARGSTTAVYTAVLHTLHSAQVAHIGRTGHTAADWEAEAGTARSDSTTCYTVLCNLAARTPNLPAPTSAPAIKARL